MPDNNVPPTVTGDVETQTAPNSEATPPVEQNEGDPAVSTPVNVGENEKALKGLQTRLAKEKQKRRDSEARLLELEAKFEGLTSGDKTLEDYQAETAALKQKLKDFEMKEQSRIEQRRESLEARGELLDEKFKSAFNDAMELGNLDYVEKQLALFENLANQQAPPRSSDHAPVQPGNSSQIKSEYKAALSASANGNSTLLTTFMAKYPDWRQIVNQP